MKSGKKERKPGLLERMKQLLLFDADDEYLDYDEADEMGSEEDGRAGLYTGSGKSNTGLYLVKGAGMGEKDDPKPDAPGKKEKGNLRLMNAPEPEEEIWEEDEGEKERPWVTVLTFLGLAVLAAIICGILWFFTHKPKDGGQNPSPDGSAFAENGSEASSEEGEDPDSGQAQREEGDSLSGLLPGEGKENGGGQTVGTQGMGQEDASQSGQESDGSAGTEGNVQNGQEEQAGQGNEYSEEISQDQVREPADGTTAMNFQEQQESVTPKDVVNLRSVPATSDEGNIVVQCRNGEILNRTGVNHDTGWSRLDYNGQTVYAVTQYLTTNLDYKPPVQASNPNRVNTAGGRVIIFSDCDDWISPKEYVNLRLEPSTDGGEDTVSCQLNYGEKAHRTGYSADSGWSRVEYDGKVLYVVTSLMYVVEPD